MRELVSFDLWDTLLRRQCHPEQIKRLTALYTVSELDLGASPRRAYLLRLAEERRQARKNFELGLSREFDHEDVHRAVLAQLGVPPAQRPDVLFGVLRRELDLELDYARVDPEGRDRLIRARARGARTIVITDFYMSAPWVARILEAKGLAPMVDELYVSTDYSAAKRDGTLYTVVRKAEGIGPESHWRHYGDNPHSDVAMARQAGVVAELFQPERAHADRLAREARFTRLHGLRWYERLWLAQAARRR